MPDGALDIDLMTEIANVLGMAVEFIPYDGADFNGIFDALNHGAYDCVTAGTTVTPQREKKAQFVAPYLISGQALATDVVRLPRVHSIDDLAGLTIGVQQGNTSRPVADELVAQEKAAGVRVYDYGIRSALTDLTNGGRDVFMKLDPVLTELVKPRRRRRGGAAGISAENIAIAVALADQNCSAGSPWRRPSWRRTARCTGSGGNGWAILADQSLAVPEPCSAVLRLSAVKDTVTESATFIAPMNIEQGLDTKSVWRTSALHDIRQQSPRSSTCRSMTRSRRCPWMARVPVSR